MMNYLTRHQETIHFLMNGKTLFQLNEEERMVIKAYLYDTKHKTFYYLLPVPLRSDFVRLINLIHTTYGLRPPDNLLSL